MGFALTPFDLLLLSLGGIGIGVWGSVLGGAQFLSLPLFQILLPGTSMGVLVGNLKVGSVTRSAGNVITTRQDIAWRRCLYLAIPLLLGAVIGATMIAHLDQNWVLPAVLLSILASEFSPKWAAHFPRYLEPGLALVVGVYAGIFGAGIALLLVSLFRLREPCEDRIAHIKIQARCVELLLAIATVAAHAYHGNLRFSVWAPWAFGSLIGGYIGGALLLKLTDMSGQVQVGALRAAEGLALIVAFAQII